MNIKNKLVIARLIGGLGNQLFQTQYAFNYISRNGGTLMFDKSYLDKSSKAHEKLAISELIQNYNLINLPLWQLLIKRTLERAFYKMGVKCPSFFRPIYLFNDLVSPLFTSNKVIIDGFWQNKKYLSEDFVSSVRKCLHCQGANDLVLIDDQTICVHIRRGDYLTNKHNGFKQQFVLGDNYYKKSLDYFSCFVSSPTYHIYTDDELWAVNYFYGTKNAFVMKTSEMSPLGLLSKMSIYKNYIIANSTLSWWAAVLSIKNEKRVVIPEQWGINQNNASMCFDGWISI